MTQDEPELAPEEYEHPWSVGRKFLPAKERDATLSCFEIFPSHSRSLIHEMVVVKGLVRVEDVQASFMSGTDLQKFCVHLVTDERR